MFFFKNIQHVAYIFSVSIRPAWALLILHRKLVQFREQFYLFLSAEIKRLYPLHKTSVCSSHWPKPGQYFNMVLENIHYDILRFIIKVMPSDDFSGRSLLCFFIEDISSKDPANPA